jgi:hypothetical protein
MDEYRILKKYWWLVVLILVGMGLSVMDYKKWKYEETKNYGHGPDVVKPLELTKLFQNKVAGIRIRYPGEWKLEVNPKFDSLSNSKKTWEDVLIKNKREQVLEIGSFKLSEEYVSKNFPDVVNDEVKMIGTPLSRERQYIVTMAGDVVVLTWEKDGGVWQRAMVARGNRLVIMDVNNNNDEWKKWETTYWEMYKSLVLI